ncbi:hypothetical protein TNCV_3678401 [Trichonephila clavipes]|nr:hypothetical protein TNCV_3678401 [Trichonephila clavipes]
MTSSLVPLKTRHGPCHSTKVENYEIHCQKPFFPKDRLAALNLFRVSSVPLGIPPKALELLNSALVAVEHANERNLCQTFDLFVGDSVHCNGAFRGNIKLRTFQKLRHNFHVNVHGDQLIEEDSTNASRTDMRTV